MVFAVRTAALAAASALALMMAAPSVLAQSAPVESKGRGAPFVPDALPVGAGGPGAVDVEFREGNANQQVRLAGEFVAGAQNGEVPEGITPLERDIFTSDDFYADRELWTDPLYFRCNSTMALESQWGAYGQAVIGDNPPGTGAWGMCDRDYPREAIVSPYEFKTAKEHYEALLAEAEARGGPTQYDLATVPDWTGRYDEDNTGLPQWMHMNINQTPTILSLLTPEYQTRMVQEAYHHANTNAAMWPSQFCWPEGLLRWYTQPAVRMFDIISNDQQVQFLAGVADNFLRQVNIGRSFNEEGAIPRLGQDVPRWYGETIGFWDGEDLITWTSNVQGWKTHSAFEHSNQFQVVEIYSPRKNEAGELDGIMAESIMYDAEALVEPVRVGRYYKKVADLNQEGTDPYVFIECVQTIFPIDGRATPLTPGTKYEATVPDMYGRPWAQLWSEFHEQNMTPPEATQGLFGF